VLDAQAPGLLGVPADYRLDKIEFAADALVVSELGVAGRPVLQQGQLPGDQARAARFAQAMAELWTGVD